jgi:hypothetical protein
MHGADVGELKTSDLDGYLGAMLVLMVQEC